MEIQWVGRVEGKQMLYSAPRRSSSCVSYHCLPKQNENLHIYYLELNLLSYYNNKNYIEVRFVLSNNINVNTFIFTVMHYLI